MDWQISKTAYLADYVLVPLYAIAALIAAAIFAPFDAGPWLFAFLGGWFAWSLTEYIMHRWVFHALYEREHHSHHAAPTRWIGVAPWFIAPVFALFFVASLHLFGGPRNGGGYLFFVGYCVGYYAYIGIHLLIHHSAHEWVAKLRATHEMHHKGADANFGVSTNFWDHVFRTYQAPPIVVRADDFDNRRAEH